MPEKQILMVYFSCKCITTLEVMWFFFFNVKTHCLWGAAVEDWALTVAYLLLLQAVAKLGHGRHWVATALGCRGHQNGFPYQTWNRTQLAWVRVASYTGNLAVSCWAVKKNKRHRPKKGVRLENTLNWNQSIQISGCEEVQAFLWSKTCFKLLLISPGISWSQGTGTEIQTRALDLGTLPWDSCFCLRSICSLRIVHFKLSVGFIRDCLVSLWKDLNWWLLDFQLNYSVYLYDDSAYKSQTITKTKDNQSCCTKTCPQIWQYMWLTRLAYSVICRGLVTPQIINCSVNKIRFQLFIGEEVKH